MSTTIKTLWNEGDPSRSLSVEVDDGPSASSGTAASGTTAVESGDSKNHVTTLTIDTTLPAIAGGADLAVGKLLYTFPSGIIRVKATHMNLSIQQTDGNITADTPDGGIGTTLASGANALLSDVGAASENMITGQTFNDCDGTPEVVTLGTELIIDSSGDKTVYFNVADGWAASGDAAAGLSGTVVIEWTKLT